MILETMIPPQRSPFLSYLNDKRITPFLLILFLLIPVYWNSFYTSWQMDDLPNIIDNPGLRINNFLPESLFGTFFANQGKAPALFRPLPCLTFALNWYIGRNNPFGYHVVNLGCHIATSWALYRLMIHLLMVFKHSRRGNNREAVENIALLATILWAVNPIQTQAVTYIVQRMAIMAALFYVLGMLYFLKARTNSAVGLRVGYGAACFLWFVCGLGCKENAVLLPMSLILVEWIFFRNGSLAFFTRPKALAVGTVIVFGALFTAYFTFELPRYILTGYDDRPFTMMERLITEPRIVLGYLSQIFYPIPDRLSIAHDVELSTSLFQPWTTFPALILVLSMIAGALVSAKRFSILSFAVLFYFLNHGVESTLLPLELVFEHRNYLPSLFLFLPVAGAFYSILIRLPRYSIRRAGIIGILILVIVELGLFTHTRNKAWATPESLWRDAAIKAPDSIRPLVTLGIQLGWRDNPTPADYRHALVLFQRSLDLSPNRNKERSEILGNMAGVYFHIGNNIKAIELYHQAVAVDTGFHKNRADLIKPLMVAGRFDEAEQQAQYLITARPDNPDYMNLLGFVLLWQNKNKEALACFQSAMGIGPAKDSLLMNLGVALTRTGHLDRGRWFLGQAIQNNHDNPMPMFAIIENRVRAGDYKGAKECAEKLVEVMPAPVIVNALNSLSGNYRFVPIAVDLIRLVLSDAMDGALQQLN